MRVFILIFLFALANCEKYTYKELELTVPVDHFSFTNNNTFQLRYFVNETFWRPGGPIFFYTGNEGDIEVFAQNTGFMWEIAPSFDAMVVFAEHRYYGKSMPFGNKSFSDASHLGYLTSTQALRDFVYVVNNLQTIKNETNGGKRSPVIAFGGSYGGMLAAWMRLKYPYVVDAAVASSAPVFQFQSLTECSSFTNIVASVYKVSSAKKKCAGNIKKSWPAIRNVTSTPEGKTWLTNEWKLCKPLNSTEDLAVLLDGLRDIYGNVAMINYPYPTDFLKPVPANPVRELCAKLDEEYPDQKTLLSKLKTAISIYTNYTGTEKCLDFSDTTGAIDSAGWNFQACTEIIMPMCTNKQNEMFEPETWDLKKFSDDCYKQFGVRPIRSDLAIMEYGGKDGDYSNVIFTNGLLDPWSPGGYLSSNVSSVYAIVMLDTAHHLDLRASNPKDPISVVKARTQIKNLLHIWLKMFKQFYFA